VSGSSSTSYSWHHIRMLFPHSSCKRSCRYSLRDLSTFSNKKKTKIRGRIRQSIPLGLIINRTSPLQMPFTVEDERADESSRSAMIHSVVDVLWTKSFLALLKSFCGKPLPLVEGVFTKGWFFRRYYLKIRHTCLNRVAHTIYFNDREDYAKQGQFNYCWPTFTSG